MYNKNYKTKFKAATSAGVRSFPDLAAAYITNSYTYL